MTQLIKQTDIAIITTEAVDKTFDNQDAYLHGMIVPLKDDTTRQERSYKVRTDMVGYQEVEVPITKENGSTTAETKLQLVWLEQKQDWSVHSFSYAQIDAFATQVAPLLPEGLGRTAHDMLELQLMFLSLRKQEGPWGIVAEKWRLRTNDDLLKNIEK